MRGLHSIFKAIGAIPVERSGRDLTATRAALRALNDGRILGVFPEGRIETSRELLPFQTGVALMAIKAEVPIYTAYLDGTQRGRDMVAAMLTPCVARLVFGDVVSIDRSSTSRDALDLETEVIKQSVRDLQKFADQQK